VGIIWAAAHRDPCSTTKYDENRALELADTVSNWPNTTHAPAFGHTTRTIVDVPPRRFGPTTVACPQAPLTSTLSAPRSVEALRISASPTTQSPGAVHEIASAEPPRTPKLMGRGVIVTPATGVVIVVADVADETVVAITGAVVDVTGTACADELSARGLKVAATVKPTSKRRR
jgi:hypothetical protein